MRTWGPLRESRWEPQSPPAGEHPGNGVLYAGTNSTTPFGEVFQQRRAVTVSGSLALAGWAPTRALSLLDLTSGWPVRNKASASLHAAPKSTCRNWAHAIRNTWPELDGLFVQSTITGTAMVVLFAPAVDSFPAGPQFWHRLSDPSIAPLVVAAADDLGWPIRALA